MTSSPVATPSEASRPTAIVYCEANFGDIDGKTANGLVRCSEKYRVVAIVDSHKAGFDAGVVLGEGALGIPVCRNLDDAIAKSGGVADFFVYGMAPATGMLSADERVVALAAMDLGMGIISGLHEFLADDPDFAAKSLERNVTILDVRRPRARKELRLFRGDIDSVTCPRIVVLGTDCAIGKRTTATILTRALSDQGIKAVMISTGQTGLIQGARYGIALDAIPSQFCSGELESTVLEAFECESPEVIIVEGQGALSHPAFSTSALILRGCRPHGVILQHAPRRVHRCDFSAMPMPAPADEIHLIQTFAETRVIGLTINHEGMSESEVDTAIQLYQRELGIPSVDALRAPSTRLVEMVTSAFPQLEQSVAPLAPLAP